MIDRYKRDVLQRLKTARGDLDGVIMIVLFALLGGLVLTSGRVEAARARVADPSAERDGEPAGTYFHEMWSRRLRSKAGWADAASYTMADLTMLRREMLAGYLIAGFLAALVPKGAWAAVFLHGHGEWTQVENVVIGPAIALVSFVCSIGNVPFPVSVQ